MLNYAGLPDKAVAFATVCKEKLKDTVRTSSKASSVSKLSELTVYFRLNSAVLIPCKTNVVGGREKNSQH